MTKSADRRRAAARIVAVAILCAVAMAARGQSQNASGDEEAARRSLNSGLASLSQRDYTAAMDTFRRIVTTYPRTQAAGDAQLEIAKYTWAIARDLAGFRAAETEVGRLLERYPRHDAAATGFVLDGMIALALGRGPDQITRALSRFDSVTTTFPGSDAEPLALYFAAETQRIAGRADLALDSFNRLLASFPTAGAAADGLIGAARTLVRGGQWPRAMELLERVRTRFPSATQANTALDFNTTLYRLYIRGPAFPAAVYVPAERPIAGTAGRLKEVLALAVTPDSRLVVIARTGTTLFDPKGNQLEARPASNLQGVFLDRFGAPLLIRERDIGDLSGSALPLGPVAIDGRTKDVKLAAGAMTSYGVYLLFDRDSKSILRFSAARQFEAPLMRIDARRLAISDLDVLAALDSESENVLLIGADGKTIAQIPSRATKYRWRDVVDIAFDQLGHVYVLDRTSVYVFSPDAATLVATFALPPRLEPGALAVDSAGRLFVYDKHDETVQVFQ